jgi:ankyrin repeat protein
MQFNKLNLRVFKIVFCVSLLVIAACATSSPLFTAVNKGDVSQVDQLLKSGAQVNERDRQGYTPLMHASWNGQQALVERLINSGADINVRDNSGFTALMYAAIYGHNKIVQLLILRGAKVRVEDVVATATDGASSVLWLLLEGDVDTNYRDKQGMTILHYLAQQTGTDGVGSIAETVLRKGANPNIKDNNGYTPLRYAFLYSNVDVAAAIRRSPLGKETVDDLSLHEALSIPARHTPEDGNYVVPQGENKSYQTAIIDCNFLIASNRKFLMLILGGPVLYAGSLAVDKVKQHYNFQSCMEKMGFKCLKDCKQ